MQRRRFGSRSAKRERKGLHVRTEKLDFNLSINNRFWLSDQLIQPLLRDRAFSVLVDVEPMRDTRRASIDQHAKSHRSSGDLWPHDEMKIAGVKAVGDASIWFVQD